MLYVGKAYVRIFVFRRSVFFYQISHFISIVLNFCNHINVLSNDMELDVLEFNQLVYKYQCYVHKYHNNCSGVQIYFVATVESVNKRIIFPIASVIFI